MRKCKSPTWDQRTAISAPDSHCGEVRTPEPFWLRASCQYIHIKEVTSQGLLLTDSRMRSNGQSSTPGQERAGDRHQGSQHRLIIKWLWQRSLISHWTHSWVVLSRCPGKSNVGTSGRNSRLGSFSKCLASRCEPGCHTVKHSGADSNRLFAHHNEPGSFGWPSTGLLAHEQCVYELRYPPKHLYSTVWFTSLQPKCYSCLSHLKEQSLPSPAFMVGGKSLMSRWKLKNSQFLNMVIISRISRGTKPVEYIIMFTYLDI